ncbi:calcium homeostasis modulator protein [Streptomyces yunnanensis]|uniref:Calcium homeostasis modulator protein n=1 Tax=Streptomyces yunnanensis TaxID=156453 RepID=A0ABY8A362_9ACTN|nr:hypothetical protein [Streptomyces yunnanensis]WEB38340.1 calcium homeostasis modulator protein [Streptomyces yunnanensis]
MARLMVLFIGIAVVFSVIAFKGGNAPVGLLFVVVAAAPVLFLGYAVVNRRRAGGATAAGQRPQQRGRRTLIPRLIALVMVVAVGYGVYWVMCEPKANDKALTRVSDFETGCGAGLARKYFPQAADRTGAGPHPIAMFTISESGSPNPAYPASGTADYWSGNGLDPHRVQLIACLDSPDEGEFLTDCKFTTDSIKLYRGVYDVTVYEAKTGKKVGSEQLSGSRKPDCPGMVYLKRGTDKLHTEPEFADYQAVLRKYVDN